MSDGRLPLKQNPWYLPLSLEIYYHGDLWMEQRRIFKTDLNLNIVIRHPDLYEQCEIPGVQAHFTQGLCFPLNNETQWRLWWLYDIWLIYTLSLDGGSSEHSHPKGVLLLPLLQYQIHLPLLMQMISWAYFIENGNPTSFCLCSLTHNWRGNTIGGRALPSTCCLALNVLMAPLLLGYHSFLSP